MTTTDPTAAPQPAPCWVHADGTAPCRCFDEPPAPPATPGEALRWAADNLVPESLYRLRDSLRRWAAELDAAPQSATPGELDLDAIEREWLVQCGPCDYGLVEMGCNCPDGDYRPPMAKLVAEVRRLAAERGPLSTTPPAGTGVHKPFTDDGVTYCGWDGNEGCGEMWPCSTVRAQTGPPDEPEADENGGPYFNTGAEVSHD